MSKPKILIFDIETAPMLVYVWGLFDQNIGLNQIKEDWYVLAWSAKWYGDPASKAMYRDNRKAKNVRDDKQLVKELCELLEEADILMSQNGKKFDVKKINARALDNGLPPTKAFSAFQHIDIYTAEKKVFAHTSHKLEYKTRNNKKYKKLKHSKFPGFELWSEVMAGNKDAWNEMKTYTIHDVLSTEERFNDVKDWITTPNMAVYTNDTQLSCYCGSPVGRKSGYYNTDTGKFQVYRCGRKGCKKRPRSKINLLSIEKKRSLTRGK